jgi:hypothetical protein
LTAGRPGVMLNDRFREMLREYGGPGVAAHWVPSFVACGSPAPQPGHMGVAGDSTSLAWRV